MATSSRQAGFLSPSGTIPDDNALEDILNPTIVGITGITANLVRPRWQPDPPTQPDKATNWVAFGLNRVSSPTQAATYQKDDTTSVVIRYQDMEFLLSFYGPNAGNYAEIFRDGLQIGQNRDLLAAADLGVIDIGEARRAPALFKEQWLTKYDMTLTLRRRTEREYPTSLLVSATVQLNTDPPGETPININVTP